MNLWCQMKACRQTWDIDGNSATNLKATHCAWQAPAYWGPEAGKVQTMRCQLPLHLPPEIDYEEGEFRWVEIKTGARRAGSRNKTRRVHAHLKKNEAVASFRSEIQRLEHSQRPVSCLVLLTFLVCRREICVRHFEKRGDRNDPQFHGSCVWISPELKCHHGF